MQPHTDAAPHYCESHGNSWVKEFWEFVELRDPWNLHVISELADELESSQLSYQPETPTPTASQPH